MEKKWMMIQGVTMQLPTVIKLFKWGFQGSDDKLTYDIKVRKKTHSHNERVFFFFFHFTATWLWFQSFKYLWKGTFRRASASFKWLPLCIKSLFHRNNSAVEISGLQVKEKERTCQSFTITFSLSLSHMFLDSSRIHENNTTVI